MLDLRDCGGEVWLLLSESFKAFGKVATLVRGGVVTEIRDRGRSLLKPAYLERCYQRLILGFGIVTFETAVQPCERESTVG
jgi:hypothetical protein